MSLAHELLPIPPRDDIAVDVIPGCELTDAHRAALDIDERCAPGPRGNPDVKVIVYRPKGVNTQLPLVVHLHGGAFCFLSAYSFAGEDANIAIRNCCVVAAVDYRLAPEHPFPAGIEDCYAALCWCVDNLAVDPDRVVVMGESSGGNFTAAVSLMARDRRGPAIRLQLMAMPCLDDRLESISMAQFAEVNTALNKVRARGMWLHYLGEDHDPSTTSPYAAPARATSLAELPPAFIQVNGLDPLRDEGILYAMRLMAEGISVELYCAPGLHHGLVAPENPTVEAGANALRSAALTDALA